MNENQLSKRLEQVSIFIPKDSRLADIGSDHAYLPVALALQGKITYAIAGEVVTGPFESATKQVKKHGLQQQVLVRLADGLDAIAAEDEIDTITICGMGGSLIRDILEAGWNKQRIFGHERLILQPNIGEKNVREWLTVHGYTILAEAILKENQKIYEIIVAERCQTRQAYSQKEQRFGPILLKERTELFKEKWHSELIQRETIVAQLQKSEHNQKLRIQALKEEIAEIKEIIADDN